MSYGILPDKYREGIKNWIEHGIEPGGFLCAVLKNDFGQAISRADESTTFAMFLALRRFLYCSAPPQCFGHPDDFESWPVYREEKGERGMVWDVEDACWAEDESPALHLVK